jgi:hypothetical protein
VEKIVGGMPWRRAAVRVRLARSDTDRG